MPRRPLIAARPYAAGPLVMGVLWLAVGSAGCFSPRFESGKLQCAGEGRCPEGFYCAQSYCWRTGESPPDAAIDVASDAGEVTAPTVVQAAAASPSTVTLISTELSVVAEDAAGEAGLTYSWSVGAGAPGTVGFSANGTNSARTTTAIFIAAGRYLFNVVIENRAGLRATSAVEVEVQQRVNDMAVSPGMVTVPPGGTQQFTVTAFDQFGAPLPALPSVRWMLAGSCGVVNDSGLFQASAATSGSCAVTASSGAIMVTASVSVGTTAPLVIVPLADAHVEDAAPDRNFGSATTMLVKTQAGTQNNRVAYLRFPVPPLANPVTSARLRLFGKSAMSTHNDGVFLVADHGWLEGTINWRNRPALGARQAQVGVTTAPKYHEWDLTALVKSLPAGQETTLDLAVQMEVSAGDPPDTFESREAANKPQLVLTP